jgi:hypothetical protein
MSTAGHDEEHLAVRSLILIHARCIETTLDGGTIGGQLLPRSLSIDLIFVSALLLGPLRTEQLMRPAGTLFSRAAVPARRTQNLATNRKPDAKREIPVCESSLLFSTAEIWRVPP